MELDGPQRDKLPEPLVAKDISRALDQFREYDSKSNAFWRGVADEITELNAEVVARRQM